jgi:RecA-family ATPase
VLRWSDLKDRPIPPIHWLLEPFFPAAPFGILASAPGHGKSILALQLAAGIATGLPVLGRPACGPAGAGILAMEDGEPTIHRRLDAIRQSYGFAWQPEHDALLDANLRLLVRGKEMTGDPAHLGAMTGELVAEMSTTQDPPAALFLDTLNSIYAHDENDNTAARLLASTIFRLHDALGGCSIWALHHIRKAGIGRNAPSLADRVDPELVRGASALAASARAMVQLGWITPNEAQKAGLDPENANRRFGILALSKINDGPLSQWVLMEHDADHAGLWTPAPDGDHLLAALRGGNAAKEMDRNERILLDLAHGSDRKTLENKFFPGDPKAMEKLKAALRNIRTRQEWIQKGSLALTEKGLLKVRELEGDQATESEHPENQESPGARFFEGDH